MPAYMYCVSCMANYEAIAAKSIEESLHIRAIYLRYDREERKDGEWCVVTHPMLWGYIFLYAQEPVELLRLYRIEHVNAVLKYNDGESDLRGEDRAFAKWVLECGGHIALSRALLVGDRTRIVDGPLKDYEGVITKLDRHRRFAWVNVAVGDDVKPIRMYFEWLTVQDGRMIRLREATEEARDS